jgi:hypothetical protein
MSLLLLSIKAGLHIVSPALFGIISDLIECGLEASTSNSFDISHIHVPLTADVNAIALRGGQFGGLCLSSDPPLGDVIPVLLYRRWSSASVSVEPRIHVLEGCIDIATSSLHEQFAIPCPSPIHLVHLGSQAGHLVPDMSRLLCINL